MGKRASAKTSKGAWPLTQKPYQSPKEVGRPALAESIARLGVFACWGLGVTAGVLVGQNLCDRGLPYVVAVVGGAVSGGVALLFPARIGFGAMRALGLLR